MRFCGAWLAITPMLLAAAGASASAAPQRVVDEGIAIDFVATRDVHAGDPVAFDFNLTDTASDAPLAGVRPAAWLSRRHDGAAPVECKRQVATFVGGDLFNRADVDLNSYFVLSLNDGNSISVVDPLFGFGGSKLLAMLTLPGAGADWALSADQSELFVTVPDANEVTVADTRRWTIVKRIATGPHPRQILVIGEHIAAADDEGITLIDAGTLAANRVRFGATRALAPADETASIFAASSHSVLQVDLRRAQVIHRTALDAEVDLLSYSNAAKAIYAVESSSGRGFVVDARTEKLTATFDVQPGATQIRFAPDGRHALLPNPSHNLVQVLDAARNTIMQNAQIDSAPDSISFSDLVAYVHRRDSETVVMIPLEQIGRDGHAINVADFPAGQHALGASAVADSIVPAPEGPSVLVANPDDKMVYLYKEGMAAPAGGFNTGIGRPRAALVVDHGLREHSRGHYTTSVPVHDAGTYDVALFLDAPRVIACFTLTVAPNTTDVVAHKVHVAALDPPRHLTVGAPAHLQFAISGGDRAADDVRALVFEAPGVWQQRVSANKSAGGRYEVDFVPPEAGMYYVWIESESLGLDRGNSQFSVYQAN